MNDYKPQYDENDEIVWTQERLDALKPITDKMLELVTTRDMPLPYAVNRLHHVYGYSKEDVSEAFVLYVRTYVKDNKPLN